MSIGNDNNEPERVFAALIDDLLSCGRISPIEKTIANEMVSKCKQPLKKSGACKDKADTQNLYGLRSDIVVIDECMLLDKIF